MKQLLFKFIKKGITPILTRIDSKIPRYVLEQKHVQNAKILVDRFELLKMMPKNAVVAEIGVASGDYSSKIIQLTNPSKLHLVDFWGSSRYNEAVKNTVYTKFDAEIKSKKIEISLGLSTQVVDGFQNDYFDWIYIDTDHTYKTTLEELLSYAPKMKQGGIISGHDYIQGNWTGLIRYGVIEAVYEFCSKHNWEIIYIPREVDYPSFPIRKI